MKSQNILAESVPYPSGGECGVLERAHRYLAKMPPAISGKRGHDATYHAACVLVHGFALPREIAHALLLDVYNPRCIPPWSEADIHHKICSAAENVPTKPRGYLLGRTAVLAPPTWSSTPSKWPGRDDELRHEIIKNGPGAAELSALSCVRFERESGEYIADILAFLFFSASIRDPLICVAKSPAKAATRPLSFWRKSGRLPGLSLIVPSVMSARTGLTRERNVSERCLENVGPRVYLVIEFDSGTLDEQAAILWHLAGFAPLTMVVHSGKKSLHGWFYARGVSETDLRHFMEYAVRLGADRSTWPGCHLVRLPFGLRDNGARQRVLYMKISYILNREVPHAR